MNTYQKEIRKNYKWYKRFCEEGGFTTDSFRGFKREAKKQGVTIEWAKEARRMARERMELIKILEM